MKITGITFVQTKQADHVAFCPVHTNLRKGENNIKTGDFTYESNVQKKQDINIV